MTAMIARHFQLARVLRLTKRLQLVTAQASMKPPPLRALALACDMAVTSRRLRVAIEELLTICEVELAAGRTEDQLSSGIEVVGL